MTSNAYPSLPTKKKSRKKKKSDPFWPIVIILSILAFTGSFWFFYMLTSKINTRNFPTTDTPKLMLTPAPSGQPEGSTVQAANPAATAIKPSPALSASTVPGRPAVASASPVRAASAAPTAAPSTVPSVAATVAAAPGKAAFRVQVGAYGSRDEAQQIVTQLSGKGYSPVVVEDSGRFRVQLGVYENQEGALALAEEITQQGYEVVVRKGTL